MLDAKPHELYRHVVECYQLYSQLDSNHKQKIDEVDSFDRKFLREAQPHLLYELVNKIYVSIINLPTVHVFSNKQF